MSYQTLDSFKAQFSFNFTTEAIAYSQKEFESILNQALSLYANPALSYCRVRLHATTLGTFAAGVLALGKEGYTLEENERGTSSAGSYGLFFTKPASYQTDDKEWIKNLIQDSYLSKIEQNQKTLKAKLKSDLLAEEQRKENEKVAAQKAKKESEAEKKAELEYEQLLAQFEASQEQE